MSKILKVASMAAMTVYSIVTFSLTDASAALASPLIADMIQPVPAQTSETTASSADEAAVVAGAASAETAPQQIDTQLHVMIRPSAGGDALWEGRARFRATANSDFADQRAAAGKLADALFEGFPGRSGETIEVR